MAHHRETTRRHYEQLVAAYPDLKIKGKTSAYTSMNGHMFSFITKEGGLAFRLPKEKYEAFVQRYRTQPVIEYGATMREYVAVPVALFKRPKELAGHFADSVAYIASLPPKPTTKPKTQQGKKASKKSSKKTAKKKASKKPAKKASAKKKPALKKPAKATGAKPKAKKPAARSKAKATKNKPARSTSTRRAKGSGQKATPRRRAKKRT